MRQAAAERFSGMALPTDALEDWRYSRIDDLDLDCFVPSPPPRGGRGSTELLESLLVAMGPAPTIIETHNGHLVTVPPPNAALTVEPLSEATDEELGILSGDDAFAVLNRAFAPSPLLIRVPRGRTATPVLVVHWFDGEDVACFPRVRVELAEDADATIIEVMIGAGRPLVVPVTELDLAAAARLSYLHIQELPSSAWQLALQASRLDRDATLTSAAVAMGGDYARLRTESSLMGTGGSTRLLALYFAAGTQMHDFRTLQAHRSARTRSDLLYKGVVANASRSVYSGLIRVDKGARGSNAFQTNRNLVLHQGAHADSVPNLEIEDNDVRCSHASAVGPIDEDQRFYLESRGVPPGVADRLIALGFLGEVLEQTPATALAAPLRYRLAGKLEQALADEAGPVQESPSP